MATAAMPIIATPPTTPPTMAPTGVGVGPLVWVGVGDEVLLLVDDKEEDAVLLEPDVVTVGSASKSVPLPPEG